MVDARRIYDWWLDELSKTLTPQWEGARRWKTLISSADGGIEIHRLDGDARTPLGHLPAAADAAQSEALAEKIAKSAETNTKDVLLRLSDGDVVERIIQIPKAASDVVDPVVRNQLERIVPWRENDTRFGYRIVGPNAKSPSQLDVRIVATSRKILDDVLAKSRAIGLEPSSVEFAPSSDAGHPIQLTSTQTDPRKKTKDVVQAALAALFVGCLAIAAVGLYMLFDRYSQRDDLLQRISVVRARVEANRKLNLRNAQLRQQHSLLMAQKAKDPAVMMLIERLSQALPDDTYLTELELHGPEARLLGKSDNPTALISVLEETAEFKDVRFAAPTVREENENAETFSIIATVNGVTRQETHQ